MINKDYKHSVVQDYEGLWKLEPESPCRLARLHRNKLETNIQQKLCQQSSSPLVASQEPPQTDNWKLIFNARPLHTRSYFSEISWTEVDEEDR